MAFVSSPSSTNKVNTANVQVSTANSPVSTANSSVSIADSPDSTTNLSDTTIYAFLANQPNGSQLVYEDLEQIHEDELEEMDLKWQLALLSMRERIDLRNQDNRNRNQDSSRRTVNVEETSSKAMVVINGAGFDWSFMADEKFDEGYVAFGGGAYGGKISSKGTLKTDNLDFEDVYFVNALKFNLFSVSQMCDKKNYVLFIDTECLVLSPNFKLPDENQILLKIPRKDNMYSFDMKNIVPKESLTCLVAKATLDELMLWHRRLGH
ncbi:hypothetical protein Tco_1436512 [Tanacetum coccineum]